MLISLTNNLRGRNSCPLETSTPFALPCAKVINKVSLLVLFFFLFVSGGGGGGGGGGRLDIRATQGTKSSTPAPGALRCSSTRLPFLDAWGAGREPFFIKGKRLRQLPLSMSLDAWGATLEPSLAKEGYLGRSLISNSQPTTSVSEVWAGDKLPSNVMLAHHYFYRKGARNNWNSIGRGIVTQFTKILHG